MTFDILYEDQNLVVHSFEQKSDVLLIMFNEMGFVAENGCWGGDAAFNAGFSFVSFNTRRPNWFPATSVVKALAVFSDILKKYNNIISYGHSQGGFAALKYSAILRVTSVISFCPQFSISPNEMEGKDKRFINFYNAEHHSAISKGDLAAEADIFCFFDPTEEMDALNCGYIDRLIKNKINFIKVFGTGHGSIRPFAGTKNLRMLVQAVALNDLHKVQWYSRCFKRGWSYRKAFLARSLVIKRPDFACSLLVDNLIPLNAELAVNIMEGLLINKRFDLICKTYCNWSSCISVEKLNQFSMRLINGFAELNETDNKYVIGSHGFEGLSDADNLMRGCKGMGWHTPESWGVWGSQNYCRFYFDIEFWGSREGDISFCTRTLPGCGNYYCRVYSSAGVQFFKNHKSPILISSRQRYYIVDFVIDNLIVPFEIGLNNDIRKLGIGVELVGI